MECGFFGVCHDRPITTTAQPETTVEIHTSNSEVQKWKCVTVLSTRAADTYEQDDKSSTQVQERMYALGPKTIRSSQRGTVYTVRVHEEIIAGVRDDCSESRGIMHLMLGELLSS